MNSFICLAIGLLLIFIEFFVPGAIMGTLGGLFVLASLIFFATESNSLIATFIYFLGVCVALGLLFKFALWRIRHASPSFSIYSDASQKGFQASKYDEAAIGKLGTVLSDLKPGGYIMIDGQQHQAISQSGYIVKGAQVEVVGGQEESLIVKNYSKRKEEL